MHANKNQSAAGELITPNIFTQYGLTDDDLLKVSYHFISI